jgi:hypothetical protein
VEQAVDAVDLAEDQDLGAVPPQDQQTNLAAKPSST